jgi:hypothetical protein
MAEIPAPEMAEAVRHLIGRYVEAADRGRAADLAALFLPDGVLEIKGRSFDAGRCEGREEIAARIAANVASTSDPGTIRHHVSSLRIAPLGGETARADCYFLAVTAIGPDHWGRYRDRIDLSSGAPLFAERQVIHEGFTPGGWLANQTSV